MKRNQVFNFNFWPSFVDMFAGLIFIFIALFVIEHFSASPDYLKKLKEENLVLKEKNKSLEEIVSGYESQLKEVKELTNLLKDRNIKIQTDSLNNRLILDEEVVSFNVMSTTIDSDKVENVDIIGQKIKDFFSVNESRKSKFAIIVEGHADTSGIDELNFSLSHKRAIAMIEYWKDKKYIDLNEYDIIPAGFGEYKPKGKGMKYDRRIELRFIPKLTSIK